MLVNFVLGVRHAQAPPDLCGIGIEGQDVLRMLVQQIREPVLKQLRLVGVAPVADEFHTPAQLAHQMTVLEKLPDTDYKRKQVARVTARLKALGSTPA